MCPATVLTGRLRSSRALCLRINVLRTTSPRSDAKYKVKVNIVTIDYALCIPPSSPNLS